MTISLDVVIDTPEYEVDMKSGLETLQGVSDASRCIAETLVTKKVPQRQTSKSNVRTTLKNTFKGSYGHNFSIDFFDQKLIKEYRKIGKEVFIELMSYFIKQALYIETLNLSPKAEKVLSDLDDVSDELISQLRVSALENIHSVSIRFNYEVKVRFRKNSSERITISTFNPSTIWSLEAKENPDIIDLTVCISKFNIFTGNGRLTIKGADESVPFGFGIKYKDVVFNAKKKFSENLNHNNGISSDKWIFLKIGVSRIMLHDGTIVKYIVKSFYSD